MTWARPCLGLHFNVAKENRKVDGRNNRDFTYSKSGVWRASAPTTLKCRPSERTCCGHRNACNFIQITVVVSMLSRLFLPSTAAGVILKSPQFGLQLTPGPSRHPPVTKAFSCCFSIDRNRLRGALPRPTMGAHQSAVRGMDIFEKVIRKDAPPSFTPR